MLPFDLHLKWDIFSPRVEKVLWGIFGSCLALGTFGVAIQKQRFVWCHVFRGQDGRALGVLRVQGNPRESFRDYRSIVAGTPDAD